MSLLFTVTTVNTIAVKGVQQKGERTGHKCSLLNHILISINREHVARRDFTPGGVTLHLIESQNNPETSYTCFKQIWILWPSIMT